MTHIRILYRDTTGKVFDGGVDFNPEDFAGQVPAIDDMILNPGVLVGKKRDDPRNRENLDRGRARIPHVRCRNPIVI